MLIKYALISDGGRRGTTCGAGSGMVAWAYKVSGGKDGTFNYWIPWG